MDAIESETIERDGREYLIEITPDQDAGDPRKEGDVYDEEDYKHWAAGEWEWVNLHVTPIRYQTPIRAASVILGAVEYGTNPGWKNPEHNPTGEIDLKRIIQSHVDHGKMWEEAYENLAQLKDTKS